MAGSREDGKFNQNNKLAGERAKMVAMRLETREKKEVLLWLLCVLCMPGPMVTATQWTRTGKWAGEYCTSFHWKFIALPFRFYFDVRSVCAFATFAWLPLFYRTNLCVSVERPLFLPASPQRILCNKFWDDFVCFFGCLSQYRYRWPFVSC